MSELKPCPFCGGEAQMGVNRESTVREYYIGCMNCHIRLYKIGYKRFWSETEAIAAWNSRAERTCQPFERMNGQIGSIQLVVIECSECAEILVGDMGGDLPNYCPNCGCKVVGA